MQTPPAQNLIDLWQLSNSVIHRQCQGLSQAESLLQLPFQGNCLNWVVGHMLKGRDDCLKWLGLPPLLSEAEFAVYTGGCEPLTDPARASDLDSLLARLDQALEMLTAAIQERGDEGLREAVKLFGEDSQLGGALAFLQWHEAYHLGQLELLRQLAGKGDKVI